MDKILIPQKTPVSVASKPIKQDYSNLLRLYKLNYRQEQLYYRVGKPTDGLGWIIHLSVVETQVAALLDVVLPYLAKEKLAFRIYYNQDTTAQMLAGDLGYTQIGKVVSIHPKDDIQALQVVRWALALPRQFKGPFVPTDRHLGGIVHIRYGCPNPKVIVDERGVSRNYYNNKYNQQQEDAYSVPYLHPKDVAWPFGEFAGPTPPKDPKFFKRRYGIYESLKRDAKGLVALGVNVSNIIWWRWCLIKQGKANMCHDSHGRDIMDRLTWQLDLQQALSGKVRLPKVIDFFKKNGNCYLVMEFIDGTSLRHLIVRTLRSRVWTDVPKVHQDILLEHMVNILDQISLFHSEGYVHRDITPNNFVIRKGKEYMIDLEMSYSLKMDRPHPPFRLGTFGYMSPEQLETLTPTEKEDIYGIGGTLIYLFTGIDPFKYTSPDHDQVRDNLRFFIGDESIAELIANCTSLDPTNRPTLAEIHSTLLSYKDGPTRQLTDSNIPVIDPLTLKPFIQGAINALAKKDFLNSDGLWLSRTVQDTNLAGNMRMDRQVLPGFGEGVSGVLAVLAQAYGCNYSMNATNRLLSKVTNIFTRDVSTQLAEMQFGLYGGSSGVALALSEAMEQRIIIKKPEYMQWIGESLSLNPSELTISQGISGQLLSALRSRLYLSPKKWEECSKEKVARLIYTGNKGKYSIADQKGKSLLSPWFSEGISGAIYALSRYLSCFEDPLLKDIVNKAVSALTRSARQHIALVRKAEGPKSDINPHHGLREGTAGLALAFLEAYKIIKEEPIKSMAEDLLQVIPEHFVSHDMSHATGLCGIGHVYLDAFSITCNAEWKRRAEWITLVILHQSMKEEDGTIKWYADGNFMATADLANGQAGIIHYLLRYQNPDKIQPFYF